MISRELTARHPVRQLIPGSISSSNLRFLKNAHLIWIILFATLLTVAGTAFAAPWTIAPELDIPRAEDKRLHVRTPEITSATDLKTILAAIALRHPFGSLWVEKTNTSYVVRGKPAVPVARIEFKLAPLALSAQLRAIITPYVGQVHSPKLQEKISQELQEAIAKRGYINGKVINLIKETPEEIVYIFKLDIGQPCVIAGFSWEQKPPILTDQSIHSGDICDVDDIARSIAETESKARSLGYADANLAFDGLQLDATSTAAIIKIKGRFGRKIVYEFIDQATGRSLSNIFTNADMQSFDPAILSAESVNFELLRQLRIRGYSDAQLVNTTTNEGANGDLIYRYFVQLGDITVITRLQIEGNTSFSESEIFNLLGVERPTQSDDEPSEVIFNPDAIAAGIERVRANYINKGFWDVKIIDRQIQSQSREGQGGQVIVVVSIEEGDQRVFERLSISGNQSIPTEEITDFAEFSPGEPIDRSKILDLQQKIRSLYAAKGYFYTTAAGDTSSRNLKNGQQETIVIIRIDEGPRVKFGDVFVTGLVKTVPKVVLRELHFKTGDWYDPELVSASRKALLRIGAFSTVMIRPLDPDLMFTKPDIVDLLVQVTESPSRSVNFGPGWSSYYGMRYNLEGALTNIAGTGRQLYGRASFNEEAHQKAIGSKTLLGRSISAGYLEPHILDSVIDGTVSVSQAARATDNAWSLTKGFEIELSHSLRTLIPGSKISTFYSRKLNDEEGTLEDVDAFLADTFAVGRGGLRFVLDKRNDQTWTSSGYSIDSEATWARYDLGGDLRYFRWEVTNNRYLSLSEDVVFAFGVNFTSYEDVERRGQQNSDILPASERLPAGGVDTVRGFRERSLGPIVRRPNLGEDEVWDCTFTASPTGGSRRLILKAEARYRFASSLAGTLFIDSGTSSFSQKEKQKFEKAFAEDSSVGPNPACSGTPQRSIEDNIGYEISDVASDPKIIWERNFTSAGTAINFLTPIGSINLAYGIPWHEPKSEKCQKDSAFCFPRSDQKAPLWKRGEFHFNVGAKF
jgi:outer membrane protein assembly complex protein YaeT